MNWSTQNSVSNRLRSVIEHRPVAAYFALAFAVSWAAAFAVAAPHLIRHESLPPMTGILMFPAMLLGPAFSGLLLTGLMRGRNGLLDLFSQMARWQFPVCWYAPLLMPPILVLAVLLLLKTFVSPVYAPNRFLIGVLFGLPAGFFEEIGWTGYAFEKMRSGNNAFTAAALLGLLWSIWHLPVINYLGTATPHGACWFPFFLVFAVAMTAMRVLICWMYVHTNSVLLAQLMHISSTGSLVIFSAPRASAAQEVLWYGLYAFALWAVVMIIVVIFGRNLTRSTS